MIAFTSRLALQSELKRLSGQRARVYAAIAGAEPPGLCIAEIADLLLLKEGAVCGRINELRKLGCIVDGPIKEAPGTGKKVKTYVAMGWNAAEPEPKQPRLFP